MTDATLNDGTLFVVATPIGNRDDLSERARAVLAAVDRIAAEDTRHTGRLPGALGLKKSLVSLHEHNENERARELVRRLADGETIALVSDAGTPGISDPGYRLVVAAHEHDHRVVPVPGPSAAVAALCASGQPTDRYAFEGFLPARSAARRKRLQVLAGEERTLVLYESGHRIVAALHDLVAAFGAQRPATLARELTKIHETVHRDSLGGLAEWIEADADQRRGEIVLVIAGCSEAAADAGPVTLAAALDALLPELPPTRAAAVAARLTGVPRREAYQAALERGDSGS